jgi:hypothetical protein
MDSRGLTVNVLCSMQLYKNWYKVILTQFLPFAADSDVCSAL